MAPRKIAVLGSGIAALSAVYELTLEPDWQEKYELTVYQLGWRCGGKARSGRNQAIHNRIEEHGLHILLGFYSMTFRLLFATYDYLEHHGIGCGAPFGGVRQAIRQMPSWQLQERFPGSEREWVHWPVKFRTNRLYPGEEGRGRRDFFLWSYLRACVRRGTPAPEERADGLRERPRSAGPLRRATRAVTGALATLLLRGLVHPVLVMVGRINALYAGRATRPESPRTLRRLFYTLDLACAMFRGTIVHRRALALPDNEGYRQLDDLDFVEWLRRHGLTEVSAERSPMLQNLYKTIAHNTSTLAAGAALYTVLRLMFSWTGSPQYLMNAGMGDIVVAPIYQTLRHKGVRFEFFHRVEKLRVSADGRRIAAVEMKKQCALRPGVEHYEPLVPVKGRLERPIDCWPSEPLWDQLQHEVAGVDLRELGVDEGLESFRPIPGETDATIHAGVDFDIVLDGIAMGARKEIGSELMAASPAYREFVERGTANAVAPMGGQLWLKPTSRELGWNQELPDFAGRFPGPTLCGTYRDPIAGYTDMSHVLAAEDFPEGEEPRSLAYFWGERDDIEERHRDGDRVDEVASVQDYLEEHMGHFWPAAYRDGEFQWDEVLYSHRNGSAPSGRERIRDQYMPELPSGSDLYNRVPSGSTRTRLTAGSLYEEFGLVLAGDFMRTRYNIALAEGAAESGIRAANVIRGKPATWRTIG